MATMTVQPSEYALEPLRQDDQFILYRGRSAVDVTRILMVTPALPHPGPDILRRIGYEYSLRHELDSQWAAQPIALSHHNGQQVLVLHDPGGDPLSSVVDGPVNPKRVLQIAIGLAAALKQVHQRQLIHKDIKPANILIDPGSDQIWLTGFGIASRAPRERQPPTPPQFIAGTLPYMAPEQTGRMNRSIDSRSDLYSMGVVLYEMLTGTLPFQASDPMELVHAHIARPAVPPDEHSTAIPRALSRIVMKLLAKTAEERYQTAAGLEHDLRRCLAGFDRGQIDEFPLARNDTPDRLLIPETLYGRTPEVATLLAAFDRAVAGGKPELMLVSGYSGIGKSSVVHELHKALVPSRGLFASGKFEQHNRNVPYATLVQALQALVRPILTQSETELRPWRDALRDALDPHGQLIVDLVPELRLIIGEQHPVPDVAPNDAQARFHMVVRLFIGVFARPEHPLALFFDDLQWLDPATLDVLQDLLTQPDVNHLLLIGAYRDNEVGPSHPLTSKLATIRRAGATVQDIVLSPLTREDVAQLVAHAVRSAPERARTLAELVHDKTAGNPFFAIQFLSELEDEGLLAFDHREGRWSWDVSRIRSKGYTDNVVDLLVGRLSRMPAGTQGALKQLACLGSSAEFITLNVVHEAAEAELERALWEAVEAGLVHRSDLSYHFLHDRVQEAAYSLIPAQVRAAMHLRIGRLLVERVPVHEREERIFEIVNQFNRAIDVIADRDERRSVAELNLIAATRAKSSIAYASALSYLSTGLSLLTEQSWDTDYNLTFSLEALTAECELLTADLESADTRLSMLAARATNLHDLARVTCLQLTLCTASNRLDRGVDICLDFLRRDQTDWSAHPTSDVVRREYDRIQLLLRDRTIEDLLDSPLVGDLEILDVLEVLTAMITPAVFFDSNLCAFVICRIVNLSLEHGNSDAACFAYVWFGIIGGPRFGEYNHAFRFAQLGYDLLAKRGLTRYEARTCLCFAVVLPWSRHVRYQREMVLHAFDLAYRMGDFTYAAYSGTQVMTSLLFAGDPLADAQVEAEKRVAIAENARVGLAADIIRSDLQLIRSLRGLTDAFGSFDDTQFDTGAFERHLMSNPALADAGFGYWTQKTEAWFFAGDYSSAIDASRKADQLLWSAPTILEGAAFRFYSALSHAAAWDCALPDRRGDHVEALTAHHCQLTLWAEYCPDNFEDRVALVAAELARIHGRLADAEDLYERAIRAARANGFVHNEAVAYELAARFYATRGFDTFADAYLRKARDCYLRWGADGKVAQLDERYPDLRSETPSHTTSSTIVAPREVLDISTVINVARAVSGEMVLEKLIDRVMRAAIQHAGAERGLLIVSRGDDLQVEAEATTSSEGVSVRIHGAAVGAFSESLVRYVMRVHDPAILGDASSSISEVSDRYLIEHRPRSVLALPLINQGRPIGALYLENNLTAHAFTPDRITTLKVLASQAAISLENSRLYHELEHREAKIRRLVDANILAIAIWNVDGAIVDANDAFLNLVQYDRTDVASGRVRWLDMTPLEWRDADDRALATLQETGTVQAYEKELFRKDGSRVPVLVAGALFEERSSEGVAFALDLSEQKRAEAQISALKDQLYRENLALRDEVDRASMFEEIVGSSEALKSVLARIARVAPTDSSVFITGETGTGKELIARAVHKRSGRSGGPFVSVNCAALSPALISSELFGHEKGAFTGAIQRRLGRFELADGGTIFLDEVGEVPPETQVALLRVLQEREFERVGGTQPIRVDVRLIAATNRDLKVAVARGAFRQDLFYRLNVFPIEAPPLRERKGDILTLVEYFLHRYSVRAGRKFHSIDRQTLERLQRYEWPGNIRELQNVIERSVILSVGNVFSVDELWLSRESPDIPTQVVSAGPIEREVRGEREMIEAALAESRGRVAGPSGAAAKLRIPASTLETRIKALNIRKSEFKFR